MGRGVALGLAFTLAAGAAHAAISPRQALSFVRAGDLHLSPDGKTLAYVAASYKWDVKPQIRFMDVASGSERDLTPEGKSERSPQWSPDGSRLAFLSNRGGMTEVWVMPSQGGEAKAVTKAKFGVSSYHWSPDGRAIAFLAKDDTAPRSDEGPQVADREEDLSRLWRLDLASGESRRLGRTGWRIDEFQWRDDGHLLVAATDTPRRDAFDNQLFTLSAADGAMTPLASPPQPFDMLTASPDGRGFAVRSTATGGPLERDLLMAGADAVPRDISAPPDLAVAEVKWRDPAVIWARVIDGFKNRIVRFSQSAAPSPVDLALSVDGFDVDARGDVVFAGEDYGHLTEIYLRTPDGKVRQLSHLQQGWANTPLATASIFTTASFDGTPIEAALLKPAKPAEGKAPLFLLVHGGPSSNFSAGFNWEVAWAQMLASRGWQVLMVNPRGSNGYSEAFLKANRADWGGGDFKDLMAVVDAVVARGEVDPDRLAIGGWSYGGEMTAWAITQTRRFKAAIAGAPVYDQQAEFETEGHSEGDEWYFGAPWDHPDVYARNSPATFIGAARTPTLIFDGEDDANNPVGQSKGLYRALKHLGVETQLVTYPGEGHSPRRGDYNIDMFQRILDWCDAHVRAAP